MSHIQMDILDLTVSVLGLFLVLGMFISMKKRDAASVEPVAVSDDRDWLPITDEGLEDLAESVADEIGTPLTDEMREDVATRIMHIAPTQGDETLDHFVHVTTKGLANRAAYKKLMEFHEKRRAKAKEELEKTKLSIVPQEPNASSEQPLQNA